MTKFQEVTVETTIQAPVEKVWEYWTEPTHMTKWSFASDEWHSPFAENDLRVGGKFVSRMEAKDGSMGFDFGGIYDDVKLITRVHFLYDGRWQKRKSYFSGTRYRNKSN